MNYTVLMGDIIKSRRYMRGIDEAQDLLRYSLYYLNKQFKKHIKSEARMQRGDEFQVLLTEPQYGFLFYRLLELLIFPLTVRCSMSVGDIYDNNFKSTELMYGNAYFKAGNLLNRCKEENKIFLFGQRKSDANDDFSFVVNAMANNRKSLFSRGSTVMTNNVQIIAEMLYPLTFQTYRYDGNLNIDALEKIFDLKYKLYAINNSLKITSVLYSKLEFSEQNSDEKIKFDLLAEYCAQNAYTCGVVDVCNNDEDFLSSCWKRGFNVKIAEILSTQRQTVDRTMNYLNYAEKRNYDGAIIKILNKVEGTKYD